MILNSFKRAILAIALIFTGSSMFAQDTQQENNPFEVFKEYKQWGLTLSPRIYDKAKTKVKSGIYDINANKSTGLGLGFDYIVFPSKKWSFRAGVRISVLNSVNFNISIPSEELTLFRNEPFDEDFKERSIYFSVPLEAEWKHPLSQNKFLSIRSGFEIMFYSEYESTSGLLVDPNADLNETFFILNKTSKHPIHPFFKFSPGVYFILNPFILQTSLVYQKNLRTIQEGTFRFSNLALTNSGTGTYDFSGDFIGLELTLFLKKKKQMKKR